MKPLRDVLPSFTGSEMVDKFFGGFPSIHDAEVLSIELDRELQADFCGPIARIAFLVFDATQPPDSELRHPAKLTLLFDNIEIEQLSGFNHQNATSDIRAEDYVCDRLKEKRMRFDFGENGFACRFTTSRVTVVEIQPYSPINWFTSHAT